MTRSTDLTPLLKRLRLGTMAATLPERIALARREQLDYNSFLEIILAAYWDPEERQATLLRPQMVDAAATRELWNAHSPEGTSPETPPGG